MSKGPRLVDLDCLCNCESVTKKDVVDQGVEFEVTTATINNNTSRATLAHLTADDSNANGESNRLRPVPKCGGPSRRRVLVKCEAMQCNAMRWRWKADWLVGWLAGWLGLVAGIRKPQKQKKEKEKKAPNRVAAPYGDETCFWRRRRRRGGGVFVFCSG